MIIIYFRVDGFYTVTYGDLKLIGINSNMCLTYNFFLFLEYQVKINPDAKSNQNFSRHLLM